MPLLRLRVLLARGLAELAVDDFARVVFAPEALRPPLERVAPAEEDLARLDVDLRPLLAEEREEPELAAFVRPPLDLRPPVLLDFRLAVPLEFRAPPRPDEERDDVEPELLLPPALEPSSVHLPDSTRCAASATASAISEPSLAALDITLLAACVAVSAASNPASRIARRALGLALIAAAAAASPAASISLLIAALASLSTVSLPLPLPREREPLVEDLAIASSPSVCRKRHFTDVTVPE